MLAFRAARRQHGRSRWAALAALAMALCFPLLHVNRSTYSEPLAVFVLLAGLAALAQAARSARSMDVASARAAGAVAGGLLGGAVLLRVDSLREVALLVPVAALAALQRQRHAVPLVVAAVAASAAALGLTWLTSASTWETASLLLGVFGSPWSW